MDPDAKRPGRASSVLQAPLPRLVSDTSSPVDDAVKLPVPRTSASLLQLVELRRDASIFTNARPSPFSSNLSEHAHDFVVSTPCFTLSFRRAL
jgi:hypothetical protein